MPQLTAIYGYVWLLSEGDRSEDWNKKVGILDEDQGGGQPSQPNIAAMEASMRLLAIIGSPDI